MIRVSAFIVFVFSFGCAIAEEIVSVGDIKSYVEEASSSDVGAYFLKEALRNIESKGVFLTEEGILYLGSQSDGKSKCSMKKHSWKVDYSIEAYDSSNIYAVYDALKKPITLGMYVNGAIQASGGVSFRPSVKVFGSCVRIDKVNIGISTNSIPIELTLSATILLNPEVRLPVESESGRYEIILNPTGHLSGEIISFNSVNIDVDTSYSDGTGAIAQSAFLLDPVLGFFVGLGLIGGFDSQVSDYIQEKINDSILNVKNNGISINITDRIGGEIKYVLPSLHEYSYADISLFIASQGHFPVLRPEVYSDFNNYLVESSINGLDVSPSIRQSAFSAATILNIYYK